MPSQVFSPSRLREAREAAGVTRTDVAFAVRRSEQSVWLWERGKVRPPLDVVEGIAAFLGCPVAAFFEDCDE